MCQLPSLHLSPTLPPRKSILYHDPLPIHTMGNLLGHHFSLREGKREAYYSGCGIFHKVGRGGATSNHIKKAIIKFLWKNIICRFEIPHSIKSNNRKQFDSDYYKGWCKEMGIQTKYSSPSHPQANRQADSSNKSLLDILKKKLIESKVE